MQHNVIYFNISLFIDYYLYFDILFFNRTEISLILILICVLSHLSFIENSISCNSDKDEPNTKEGNK